MGAFLDTPVNLLAIRMHIVIRGKKKMNLLDFNF